MVGSLRYVCWVEDDLRFLHADIEQNDNELEPI